MTVMPAPGAIPPDSGDLRSITYDADGERIEIIDQRWLPHVVRRERLDSLDSFATAIRDMWVRGAPLIGATAAWAIARQMRRDPGDDALAHACRVLLATRPTAVNLRWAVESLAGILRPQASGMRAAAAARLAHALCEADIANNRAIGEHGLRLIEAVRERRRAESPARAEAPVRILTHCNAGALATVDWGTATAPIYLAHAAGIAVQVWVDETRPRNQGAALTCWELAARGVPHTLVADNAGGHLMQRGLVDLVIVGSDRTTAGGDVCNKIGTYLKALAARDNGVPFYVALPTATIDWSLTDGAAIPIEERDAAEVTEVWGALVGDADPAALARVRVAARGTPASNPAFDVTPARLVTGLITEFGTGAADPHALVGLKQRIVAASAPEVAAGAA